MSNWSSKPLPEWVGNRYGSKVAKQMKELVGAGKLEWRISGTTHFELRPPNKGEPVVLTTSATADNPVYAAKWRSALRRWKLS